MTEKKRIVLQAARALFLRYGFKRVSMSDIAEAAGMSRPSLYGVFASKEDILLGVLHQWLDETIASVEQEMATVSDPLDKLGRAFEIWAVRPFEMMMTSSEVRELLECRFDFAQETLEQGYSRFETAILPILVSLATKGRSGKDVSAERTARVLASAVRGFKMTATTPDELRQLVDELLALSLR